MTEVGDWIKEVEIEDLPPSYREVAELIGVEAAVKLGVHRGGIQMYLPKLDALLESQRNKLIRRDRAGGMEYRDLAIKYRLTEVWIRQIVDHREDDDKQLDMFG